MATVASASVVVPDQQRRRAIAASLAEAGRFDESRPLWRDELCSGDEGAAWVHAAILEAMRWEHLGVAGELAAMYAAATWGSGWYPSPAINGEAAIPTPEHPPRTVLSAAKLRHDAEQFEHLRRLGMLGPEFDDIVKTYRSIAERLTALGPEARCPLEGEDAARIGHVYNRIVHLAAAERTERALSSAWDPIDVEDRYLAEPPGLVVIDDFLAQEALERLRRFCIESTVWSGTRYSDGRLGAFFVDGFTAPIALQIAEEVRRGFPRMIGDRHPLRQLWAYKYAPFVAGTSTLHADFAAVNVNLWITEDADNLDPDTGGLVIYDVTAPPSWDFETYNRRPDLIASYLQARGARAITIPYRENRAIVFNSDLFHATAPIRFRPGYEHRRINVTMLYGDRRSASREHHRDASTAADGAPMWRSPALRRARR
jgi:hypothetical protein